MSKGLGKLPDRLACSRFPGHSVGVMWRYSCQRHSARLFDLLTELNMAANHSDSNLALAAIPRLVDDSGRLTKLLVNVREMRKRIARNPCNHDKARSWN